MQAGSVSAPALAARHRIVAKTSTKVQLTETKDSHAK